MPKGLRFIGQRWFHLFPIGAILFFAAEQSLKLTDNLNLIPTVILLGAFVVPVAFVAFFYGQERFLDRTIHRETPLNLVATCLLLGGALGVLVAGLLEYETLTNLTAPGLFAVGLIEESAKLIFPLGIYLRARYRSAADGLLFGVASGMGFADLETMGYGLVTLINSQGNVGVLEEVLLIRGLLSPLGHASWTGLVCAVLWRQRQLTGKFFTLTTLGAFLLAIVLHALWDLAGTANSAIIVFGGYVVIGGASFALLINQLRATRHITQPVPNGV